MAILVVLKRPCQTCSFCVGGIFNMGTLILNFCFEAAVSIVIILAMFLSVLQSATPSLLYATTLAQLFSFSEEECFFAWPVW